MSSQEDLHFQRFIITEVNPTVDFRELASPSQVAGAFEASVYHLLWERQNKSVDFATKATKKQRNCTKGYACGGSCIAEGKKCNKKLDADATKAADYLDKKVSTSKTTKKVQKTNTDVKSQTALSSSGGDFGKNYSSQNTPSQNNGKKESFETIKRGENFRKARLPENKVEVTADEFIDFYAAKSAYFNGNAFASLDVTKKKSVESAIKDGVYIPDSILDNHPALKKKYQDQIAQTNQDRDRWKKIDDAVRRPLVTDDEARDYKPLMSAEEADKYTKDSFFSRVEFYHGTSVMSADSITGDGVNIDANSSGMYGKGFYLGVDKSVATIYAGKYVGSDGGGAILTTKVKAKNPFMGELTAEQMEKLIEYDTATGQEGKGISDFVKANGYDSIYNKENGYTVALDSKQVITFKQEKALKTSTELFDSGYTERIADDNENYKLLKEVEASVIN